MSHGLRAPEAMIFDMDGTLLRTETLVEPAYKRTFAQLEAEGLYVGEHPPARRFVERLGQLLEEIWQQLLPHASESVRERANELLLVYELDEMRKGAGELYPGVAETLRKLRESGVRLFVASNGSERFVKGVVETQGLGSLFEGIYTAEEHRTATKVDLVRLLLRERNVGRSAWMVGDRLSDVEAGKQNGLAVIGCDYAGFQTGAELDGADHRIERFDELLYLYRSYLSF
jgi:HAD superfamily hydrolase (TIGR01549 family)